VDPQHRYDPPARHFEDQPGSWRGLGASHLLWALGATASREHPGPLKLPVPQVKAIPGSFLGGSKMIWMMFHPFLGIMIWNCLLLVIFVYVGRVEANACNS
jgi:hypothetical protein